MQQYEGENFLVLKWKFGNFLVYLILSLKMIVWTGFIIP